jgi:hypothetical protein
MLSVVSHDGVRLVKLEEKKEKGILAIKFSDGCTKKLKTSQRN